MLMRYSTADILETGRCNLRTWQVRKP